MKYAYKIFAIFFLVQQSLNAGFVFSNQSSTVNLGSGAKLQLGENITGWDGTLVRTDGSTVSGGEIVLESGVLRNDSTEVVLKGDFKQEENGNINLSGDNTLVIEGGSIDKIISVSGTGNRIEGKGGITEKIILYDAATVLTIAFDGTLEDIIELNSGTVKLDKDINLGGSSYIKGPGTVDGQGFASLKVSSVDGLWGYPLTFTGMNDVVLNVPLTLSAAWTFQGTNAINGCGGVVTAGTGGIFRVPNGATLALNNMTLQNIQNSTFDVADGGAITTSCTWLVLAENIEWTSGDIEIKGGTVLLMRDKSWVFRDEADLITGVVTLWIDTVDQTIAPQFGKYDENDDFTRYIDGGIVKQLTDQYKIDSLALQILLGGNVAGFIQLDRNASLNPNNQIHYTGDSTLSGSGAALTCAFVDRPQVKIDSGNTINMYDISFLRVNNNTFDIAENSKLKFGDDVQMELSDDWELNKGTIEMSGNSDVMKIRGVGGRKKLTVNPLYENSGFDIGSNTLMLEDIELTGVENITHATTIINGQKVVGSIGLVGSCIVNISESNDMNFTIQGKNSEIRLLTDSVTFNGKLLYGDTSDNSIKFNFALQEDSSSPTVNFGDGFCNLTSVGGRAGLKFINQFVNLNNRGTSSMVAGERSYLTGNEVNISTNPIKQTGAHFSLEGGFTLKSDTLDELIDISDVKGPQSFGDLLKGPTSAFLLKNRRKLLEKAELSYMDYLHGLKELTHFPLKSIRVPVPHFRVRHKLGLARAKGDVRIDDSGTVTGFAVSRTAPCTVHMTGNSVIEQRRARPLVSVPVRSPWAVVRSTDTSVDSIKADDTLYISGSNNKFIVHSDFECAGTMTIGEDAELTVELHNDATFYFGPKTDAAITSWALDSTSPYTLTIPKNAVIRFKGNGTVKFSDGSTIVFDGTLLPTSTAESESYDDDRPEFALEEFAQLRVDGHRRLNVTGNGKFYLSNNADFLVSDGYVKIGDEITDYFDFVVNRKSAMQVYIPKNYSASGYTPSSILAFVKGSFNLWFDREASFYIGDKGTIQTSFWEDLETQGFINSFLTTNRSKITIESGGALALGKNRYTSGTALYYPIVWSNLDSQISGNGVVRYSPFAGASTTIEGRLQDNDFETSALDNEALVKRLMRITAALTNAVDFYDSDGNYKLLTSSDVTVSLDATDTVSFESSRTGVVYGTHADGRNFRVLPNGKKISYN
ncbi:hypothetical protein HOD08_03695 [bacterium]|nr:hypothetical protein [bacterium]